MAINWAALIPAAARGLGAYRAGQEQGEQLRRADDVASQQRVFEEWAKRRELDNSAERISAQNQRASDALAAKEQIAARDAEIKRLLANVQMFRARGEYGAEGDQQAIGQPERIATSRNEAQRGMNAEDNQTALEIARLRAAMAQQGAAGQGGRPKRAPTGEQDKSYLFYNMLRDGNRTMTEFQSQIDPKRVTAYLTSRWMKPVLTPAEQQFVQGARTYAAGVLRKESGAAIKDDELRDVMSRYIDAGLDAPDTRSLKQRQRQQYEATMRRLATAGLDYYGDADATPDAPGGASGPTAAEIEAAKAEIAKRRAARGTKRP